MRTMANIFLAVLRRLYLPGRAFAATADCIPCTGDTFPMYTWIAVMVIALIALILAVVFFCKSMKK